MSKVLALFSVPFYGLPKSPWGFEPALSQRIQIEEKWRKQLIMCTGLRRSDIVICSKGLQGSRNHETIYTGNNSSFMIGIVGADIWHLFTPFLGDLYAPSTFCHSIIVPAFFPIEPSYKVSNFRREGCPAGVEITMSGRFSKHISWSLQVFRTFRLTRKTDDGVETRIVKHFHFTEWELDSFPYISAFIELRRRVRQYMEKNPVDAPIIVHCRWARRHGLPFAFRVNLLRSLSAPPSCAPKCSVPTKVCVELDFQRIFNEKICYSADWS